MSMSSCSLNALAKPCPSCPWRMDKDASDIPNFSLALAEGLSTCCPDNRGMGPECGAGMFACHQSKDGAKITCAGWLATVGHRHPGVRLAVAMKRLNMSALRPGNDWPTLHSSYQDVLEKLRATALVDE